MSAVPERDLVDRALNTARDTINARHPQGSSSGDTSVFDHKEKTQMYFQLTLVEALVRQIRDADNTQYALTEALEAHGNDLGTIIGALDINLAPPSKKGLFSHD